MDAKTCLEKMRLANVLSMATVDENGNPQIRCVSAVHYEPDGFYFFTARGKEMAKQLLSDGRLQTLVHTEFNEMIRLSGKATPVPDDKQKECIDVIFSEYPFLNELYPGDTREIGIVFEVKNAEIEYFNLDARPIFRAVYSIGDFMTAKKGYYISDKCIACGKCEKLCPQNCIKPGNPYSVIQEHCLHCGRCFENCPVNAIDRF